jgi:hypothetical protein
MQESDDDETAQHGTPIPLAEAIENLCYAYLEEAHGGWEVNDGSYGTFAFTVADGSVVLDFNLRFSDSENYEHRF